MYTQAAHTAISVEVGGLHLNATGKKVFKATHVLGEVDLPGDGDEYVHRGGRCGRMGLKGEVISIVSEREEFVVERLANEVGAKVEKLTTIGT